MIALEAVELKLNHQERSKGPQTTILEDVAFGHLLHQSRAEIHGLRLVVRVLGEAQPLVHVELRQVDDDGAVGRRDVGHVDHPAALDRQGKGPGEIRCVYNAPRVYQVTAAIRIKSRGDTRQAGAGEIQKQEDAGYGRPHLRLTSLWRKSCARRGDDKGA